MDIPAINRAFAARWNPDVITPFDRFVVTGDSIPAGVGDDGVPVMVPERTAYNLYIDPLAGGGAGIYGFEQMDESNAIGGQAAWTHFGQRWSELTGRRSIWSSYAKSSSSIMKASSKYHWDYEFLEWLSVQDGGHMLKEPAGNVYTETEGLLGRMFTADAIEKRYVIYAGGSFDAGALRAGVVTKQQITDKLIETFEWWRDSYGYDKLLIIESGVIGQTAQEVAANQANPTGKDMVGLREAQNDACDNLNIVNVYSHAADPGDPFNTLAVTEEGYWESGHYNYDANGHYHGEMNAAIGKTAAYNLAVIEGYIEGSII